MKSSAFNLGIIASKKGKGIEDNYFDKESEPQKHQWWREGYEASTDPKHTDSNGKLICNKPVYEKASSMIE